MNYIFLEDEMEIKYMYSNRKAYPVYGTFQAAYSNLNAIGGDVMLDCRYSGSKVFKNT